MVTVRCVGKGKVLHKTGGTWIQPTTPPSPSLSQCRPRSTAMPREHLTSKCAQSSRDIKGQWDVICYGCFQWFRPGLLLWEPGLKMDRLGGIKSWGRKQGNGHLPLKIIVGLDFHKTWNTQKSEKIFPRKHSWLNYTFQKHWKGTGLELFWLYFQTADFSLSLWHAADIYAVTSETGAQWKV